jgi:hypothetical protein
MEIQLNLESVSARQSYMKAAPMVWGPKECNRMMAKYDELVCLEPKLKQMCCDSDPMIREYCCFMLDCLRAFRMVMDKCCDLNCSFASLAEKKVKLNAKLGPDFCDFFCNAVCDCCRFCECYYELFCKKCSILAKLKENCADVTTVIGCVKECLYDAPNRSIDIVDKIKQVPHGGTY